MDIDVCVLPGDGVGPAVTEAALRVMEAACGRFRHELTTEEAPIGWAAVRTSGSPLPERTLRRCREADAVLLGAVGDPAAADLPAERRPEAGLLRLRRELGVWANLRPVRVRPGLADRSPMRREMAQRLDVVVVRELGGGLYYGEPRRPAGEAGDAVNTMRYGPEEVRRVARVAFDLAEARGGGVTSVDKANVLEASVLWRRIVGEVASERPDVPCRHLLVDRAAMDLLLEPDRFDVVLTSNLFGDVLSDELAGIAGSIGLLGSASLGDGPGLFEPVHGSAPDLEPGTANPVGAIVSAAMLLRHVGGLDREADLVEDAVDAELAGDRVPADLARPGERAVSTRAFADAVARRVAGTDGTDGDEGEADGGRQTNTDNQDTGGTE